MSERRNDGMDRTLFGVHREPGRQATGDRNPRRTGWLRRALGGRRPTGVWTMCRDGTLQRMPGLILKSGLNEGDC